jgi:RNA polymerase sigma-70 factor (ECF subfamily)
MDQVLAKGATTAPPSEAELIRDARAGDREAFDLLMTIRLDRAFRTAMAILGHEADARDATQEVFVKTWRELRTLRDPARFDAWFGRIVVNTCRSSLRRRYRSQNREIPVTEMIDGWDVTSGPAEGFEDRTALLDQIERAFEQLSVDDRALLVVHHLDHQSVASIAGSLGIPEGTAKSRLHTARRALERALEVQEP